MWSEVLYAILTRPDNPAADHLRQLVRFTDTDGVKKLGLYPRHAAQGKPFPRATYELLSTNRPRMLDQGGASGLAGPRIAVMCWHPSDAIAADLARRMRRALDGFRGRITGYFVQSTEVQEQSGDWDTPAHGDEVGVARETLEVVIWYDEP